MTDQHFSGSDSGLDTKSIGRFAYRTSIYLVVLSTLSLVTLVWLLTVQAERFGDPLRTFGACTAAGGLGGTVYCLRALYLNFCLKRKWDERWVLWYMMRPMVSAAVGAVSWLFLVSGLLALGGEVDPQKGLYGYVAVAFLAGHNVDQFLRRIESIGKSALGVDPTRQNDSSREERNE